MVRVCFIIFNLFIYTCTFLFLFCEQRKKKSTKRKKKDAIVFYVFADKLLSRSNLFGYAESLTLTIVAMQHVRDKAKGVKAEHCLKCVAQVCEAKECGLAR